MHTAAKHRQRCLVLLFVCICLLWLFNNQALALGLISSGKLCQHGSQITSTAANSTMAPHAHHQHDTNTDDNAFLSCQCGVYCVSCLDYFAHYGSVLLTHKKIVSSPGSIVAPPATPTTYISYIPPLTTPPPR